MRVIFGGAFNPVHVEHINMIKHLLTLEYVEKVILLPSDNPPHKSCPTSFEQRVDMLNLAICNLERVEICDMERYGSGKRYTCETLPILKQKYGDIAFVIGGDSLENFDKWKNPREIIKICPLIVFTRGRSQTFEEKLEFWRAQGGDIRVCDYAPEDISSTVVRSLAELNNYKYVASNVAEYIEKNGLYSNHAALIEKLKSNIPAHTFEHCLRTAAYAVELNYSLKLGLDYDKVLLAGVLHDCAKAKCHEPHETSKIPKDSIGTPVEHQFLGAVVAKEEYGIDDEEILSAIEYHTTGKRNMTALQKLIFCSDMLECGRNYPEVGYLRSCIEQSLDYGYRECALAQYEFLLQKGGEIYPLTLEAVDECGKENKYSK